MQYFSEMTFLSHFNLLLGMEGDDVIFAHHFRNRSEMGDLIEREKAFFPQLQRDDRVLAPILKNLSEYEKGKDVEPAEIKVKFSRGTHFEQAVWRTLRKTRKGGVITYKELAEEAGYLGAQQAVGQAMSKNYLLLFVPCHRVIATNGKLGGFSAGVDLKKMLLSLEKVNIGRLGKNHEH